MSLRVALISGGMSVILAGLLGDRLSVGKACGHLLGFLPTNPLAGTICLERSGMYRRSHPGNARVCAPTESDLCFRHSTCCPIADGVAASLAVTAGIQPGRDSAWAVARQRRPGSAGYGGRGGSRIIGPINCPADRGNVAIARAAINEPRLILADRSTGNVDSSMAQTILRFLSPER